MTARISLIPEKTRGHRPRLQLAHRSWYVKLTKGDGREAGGALTPAFSVPATIKPAVYRPPLQTNPKKTTAARSVCFRAAVPIV